MDYTPHVNLLQKWGVSKSAFGTAAILPPIVVKQSNGSEIAPE